MKLAVCLLLDVETSHLYSNSLLQEVSEGSSSLDQKSVTKRRETELTFSVVSAGLRLLMLRPCLMFVRVVKLTSASPWLILSLLVAAAMTRQVEGGTSTESIEEGD